MRFSALIVISEKSWYHYAAKKLSNFQAALCDKTSAELREAAADLAALKFDVLKVIAEAYDNDNTYQL